MEVAVRVVAEDDLEVLTALSVANRGFLAPWEPARSESFYTRDHQQHALQQALALHADGLALPCVITVGEEIVGRINVHNIVRGPFLSGDLGYWVGQEHTGRGIATAAVAEAVRLAFGDGLHRLQAGTLVHNAGSQKVLQRNGFTRIGLAPRYLQIDGRWQDHLLFQRLNEPPANGTSR